MPRRTAPVPPVVPRVVGAVLGAVFGATVLLSGCGGSPGAAKRAAALASGVDSGLLTGPSSAITPAPQCTLTGTVVTSTSAPFCYPLPRGFRDDSTRIDYAYGWQWRTLVSRSQHDLIQVIGQPVQDDLDGLTGASALAFAQQQQLRVGVAGVRTVSALQAVTVDGARAYRQDATFTNGVSARTYTVFRGHAVVNISCQYLPADAPTVTPACDALLAAVQILEQ